MSNVEKLKRGEDISATMEASWGPETELGRPVHLAIDVRLKETDDGYCVSIGGSIDIKACASLGLYEISSGGQCLDTAQDALSRSGLVCGVLDEIVPIWRKYHLNDMRAGSERQERYLDEYESAHPGVSMSYDDRVDELRRNGLLFDGEFLVDGKPYKYGSRWLFRAVPDDVLERLCMMLDGPVEIRKRDIYWERRKCARCAGYSTEGACDKGVQCPRDIENVCPFFRMESEDNHKEVL